MGILVGLELLFIAVGFLHLGGFALGYIVPKLFGSNTKVCKTVSIEVGMQNGVMAITLAIAHFSMVKRPHL